MSFIDRKRELHALGKFWKAKEAQLIVLYGRRRIGKTELIKEFIKKRFYGCHDALGPPEQYISFS